MQQQMNQQIRNVSSVHFWVRVEKGPEDPILGVNVAFNKDTDASKVNLGVGAYRDDNGKPFILPCVREAENRIRAQNMDHEYLPIVGLPALNKASQELIFGADSPEVKEKKIVTLQALSGTGALRVGSDFLKKFLNMPLETRDYMFLPDPTWNNHIPLFKDSGYRQKIYKYYNPQTCGLNWEGMRDDIRNAPKNSIFLFHACAHNPTGVDPSIEQWKELSKICKDQQHFVFFDLAYQGFASGDPERDAEAVRIFVKDGHKVAVAQSYAKNFGLYGERVGTISFVCENVQEAEAIESQLKILVRPMYSNPPITGARIVSTILTDPELTKQWRKDVKLMADRIIGMREKLVSSLKAAGSTRDWSHITKQIGMFCFTGLTPEEVDKLSNDHHIYLTKNGRISVAGMNSGNVDYIAKSIHAVTKK